MFLKTYRGVEFVNREKEIEYFLNYFKNMPEKILWVYGPKSTGKTTIIEYIIENELLKDKNYWIKYINFRGLFVTNYDRFVESFLKEVEDNEDDDFTNKELSGELNLGVIKIKSKLLQDIKQNKKNLFDKLLINLRKIKKQKIIVIDEIQTLEDIYVKGGKLLLHEFLNFCVRLTKETHLSHIVILTSNTIFLNTIYQNSKLKETSRFKLIDHLTYNDIQRWLKEKNFSKDEIELIYEYLGGSATRIKKLLEDYKEFNSLRDYLENEADIAMNEILYMLKITNEQEIKDNFKTVMKEIVKNGYFKDSSEDKKFLKAIEVFADVEILFYDPITNITTPNSKIYHKGFEKYLSEFKL